MIDPFLTSVDGLSLGLLDTHVESFLLSLHAMGYAERTLRKKRSVAESFARWTRSEQVSLEHLNESHISGFLERFPQMRTVRSAFELTTLKPLLEYLRAEAGVPILLPQIEVSPVENLKRDYMDYLRKERGLTENSVRVYSPLIHDFLTDQMVRKGSVTPGALDALTIRDFLLARIPNRSAEQTRLLATALRSFLRFVFVRGETTVDLSGSVPTVRRWSQAVVHDFLSPEEVERVISVTDRSSASGRRAHAVLLLLARLGLRAGEVVNLELPDIRWRAGEIVVRGKGQVRDHLPLLSDIGEALELYLCKDRGTSTSRRVFLRRLAPRVGLAGPGAVGHIVRQALAQAGLRSSCRGAAHLFRHSLATRMIRNGATIAEISQVLRHRSQSATAVYAKVSTEALRSVSRPWPSTGGAR